jgi:hypothetical protein
MDRGDGGFVFWRETAAEDNDGVVSVMFAVGVLVSAVFAVVDVVEATAGAVAAGRGGVCGAVVIGGVPC